eukprot:scaffold21682_cov22-Cyclotella_meneghiniana.AAC.1
MTICLRHILDPSITSHLLYESLIALGQIALHIHIARVPFFITSQFDVTQSLKHRVSGYKRVKIYRGAFRIKRYETFVAGDTEVAASVIRVVGYVDACFVYDEYDRFTVFKSDGSGYLCDWDVFKRFKGLVKARDITSLPSEGDNSKVSSGADRISSRIKFAFSGCIIYVIVLVVSRGRDRALHFGMPSERARSGYDGVNLSV